MEGGTRRDFAITRLAHAMDGVDISTKIESGRWRGWIRDGLNRALDTGTSRWGLERPGSKEGDDLLIVGLDAAPRDLAIRGRQRRLATERRLIAVTQVCRWRFVAVGSGRHDDAVVDRRGAEPAMKQRGGKQSEQQSHQSDAAGGHQAQNQAPQSAIVCATAHGMTRPVTARRPPSARPTAKSSGNAVRP